MDGYEVPGKYCRLISILTGGESRKQSLNVLEASA